MTQYLMIGEVLKPQGIRGEVKIKPYAANHEDFRRWKKLYLQEKDGGYTEIKAICSRVHDGFAYVTLGECASIEDAEKLRGRELFIDRQQAGRLDEGEVFVTDLIGCEAIDEQGRPIGTLTDVLQHGAVDVYVFKTARGTLMAPALKAVFPTIDVAARRIDVVSDRLAEVCVREEA